MQNMAKTDDAGNTSPASGRHKSRSTSPLSTYYSVESLSDHSTDSSKQSSSLPSSPSSSSEPLHVHRHIRNFSRVNDVAELDLQLAAASITRPLPPSPNPPTPPPKSPALHPAPLKIKKGKKETRPPRPELHIVTTPMLPSRPVRLLIASLGNPQPYHSTRHSAAHILLRALVPHLHCSALVKNKSYGGGFTSFGADVSRPEYTFWQSGSQMNISGPGLSKAWKQFIADQNRDAPPDVVTGLIVMHDELELAPGRLKTRRGEGSAKGHNGIKSVQQSLRSAGVMASLSEKRFVKIGIGIGRPESRERDDVSAFVLGQVTRKEREGIEGRVQEVEGILRTELDRMGRLD